MSCHQAQPHITPLRLLLLTLSVICLFMTTAQAQPRGASPLALVGADANTFLDHYENLSGKPIMRPQSLANPPMSFDSRNIMLNDQEKLEVIETMLALNGIGLTEVGDKFLKAFNASTGSKSVTRMLEGSALDMPPSQHVFSRLIELEYLSTAEAAASLQHFASETANIVELPKANALFISDMVLNLQRMEEMLKRIDAPQQLREELIFMPIQHVSVGDIVSQLQAMQGSSLSAYLEGSTSFEADERTNQLIIVTHPGNLPLIEKIVNGLDKDVAPLTHSEVFTVSNAEATTVAELINEIISGQQDNEDLAPGTNNQNGANNPQQPDNSPIANQPQQQTNRSNTTGEDSSGQKLQFSEYVNIVADERSNSIVAYGTTSDLIHIKDLVEKIDVLLAQVQIEVVIAEVTLSDDQVRGIESFGINAGSTEDWQLVNLTGPSSANLGSAFTIGGTLPEFSMETVFNTAQRNSRVNVLSAPTIITTHNQEATINVGETRPIITSTQTSQTDTATTRSTISQEDIGIELTVKPLIGSNGVIQMEIEQKVEKVTGTTQIDSNEQPIIGTREAKSFVSIRDREMLIMGGLQEIESTETEGRMFLIGYIPIIGDLLKSDTETRIVRELIIFIRPTILRDPSDGDHRGRAAVNMMRTEKELNHYLRTGEFEEDYPEPEIPESDYRELRRAH